MSPSSLERVRALARDFIQAFDKIAETDRELTLDMAAWHGFFFMLRPVDLAALKDWSRAEVQAATCRGPGASAG
jgi:hypothetical protein